MMVDDTVVAPVLSQPSMPFAVGAARAANLGLSPDDAHVVAERAANGCPVMGLRFTGDRAVGSRFETLRTMLGDAVPPRRVPERPPDGSLGAHRAAPGRRRRQGARVLPRAPGQLKSWGDGRDRAPAASRAVTVCRVSSTGPTSFAVDAWPGDAWPETAPDPDVDTAAMRSALDTLVAQRPEHGETHAVVVVHRGAVVAEGYGPGRDADERVAVVEHRQEHDARPHRLPRRRRADRRRRAGGGPRVGRRRAGRDHARSTC